MSVSKTVKFEFFKVRVSRTLRGAVRSVKNKLDKSNVGKAETMFGENIKSTAEEHRENKMRSSAVVFVAGTAIGVSHVVAMSSKYGVKPSRKFILGVGLANGVATSACWYKYCDAARDDISEEDIHMVFDMVTSTSTGREMMSADKDGKVTDIFHTIITGKSDLAFDENGQVIREKQVFQYEDEIEDDKDDSEVKVSRDNVFAQGKPKFEESTGSADSGFSNRHTSIGVGKALNTSRKKSFIPDLDKEEAEEVSQTKEKWLDFS